MEKYELTDSYKEDNPQFVELNKENISFRTEHLVINLGVNNNPPELPPREWVHWARNDTLYDKLMVGFKDKVINRMQAIVLEGVPDGRFMSAILVKHKKVFEVSITYNPQYFELDTIYNPQFERQNDALFNKFVGSIQVD